MPYSSFRPLYLCIFASVRVTQTSKAMQTTAIRTVAKSLPQNKVILLTCLISNSYIPYTDLKKLFAYSNIVRIFTNTRSENMSPKAYTEQEEQLARFAKAMGHPARMAILRFLAGQDSCFFGDIHEVLPIAKATVSQHLKELKAAGLIQGEIEAPKVRYCINRENWAKARESFADFFCEYRKKGSCCG